MGIVGMTSICCPAGERTGIGRYSPQTSPFGLRLIFIWSCGDDLHNGRRLIVPQGLVKLNNYREK
jgi:hypothetical protein